MYPNVSLEMRVFLEIFIAKCTHKFLLFDCVDSHMGAESMFVKYFVADFTFPFVRILQQFPVSVFFVLIFLFDVFDFKVFHFFMFFETSRTAITLVAYWTDKRCLT